MLRRWLTTSRLSTGNPRSRAHASPACINARRLAPASREAHNPISVAVNAEHTVERVSAPIAGTGTNAVSNHAVDVLRAR